LTSLEEASVRSDPAAAFDALADASRAIAAGAGLQPALEAVLGAAALAAGAELAVIWLRVREGLAVRAVWATSGALAAEVDGLHAADAGGTLELLRTRVGPDAASLSLALEAGGDELGSLELLRSEGSFARGADRVAALAADLAALALELREHGTLAARGEAVLDVAGDALAVAAEEGPAATRIARVAALASGADGALLWRSAAAATGFTPVGSYGELESSDELERAATRIVADDNPVSTHGAGENAVVTLRLGQPPLGALQLLFTGRVPGEQELARLTSFSVRVAHAVRTADRAHELGLELERSRALLSVVGEAISRLSLEHTLETALERLVGLLGIQRVAVYLDEAGVLSVAASREVEGPHVQVAAALYELALSRRRSGGLVELDDVEAAEHLAGVQPDAAAAGIGAVVGLPLLVADEPIGLLALYPTGSRPLTGSESALLVALAAQLAVAVQNARLHERATELGSRLERALDSERDKAKRLQALYEISRSFAQSLSLETTLDVLAESIVTLLGVDAAVIRMSDERGLDFVARAIHVDDTRVDAAARMLLMRSQPISRERLDAFIVAGVPLVLDAPTVEELGGSLALLAPFLEKGSSAALVPVTSAGELVATLTIISLHPERPVAGEIAETALSITGQAALAIDNARLYAQQKEFADTMQRSLLPRAAPELPGLELGDVYESSARVDVGGDLYDYLTLDDGRLAVVLGDVMGHGVDATADMAMAKFVFRSLAREHTDPGAFLAAANNVVASDIAPGKFITMVEVVVDAERGEVVCAGGGHPSPRLVLPDGTVEPILARGLALGVEPQQEYATVRAALPPGACVVLYTDGVVEARRGGEQYGLERFDRLLSEQRGLAPKELALAALEACREWSHGDLGDDFAVVVIKRTAAGA
jgi:serine phosphatase RsbU (regulator of sigma subunit)